MNDWVVKKESEEEVLGDTILHHRPCRGDGWVGKDVQVLVRIGDFSHM